jgi:hypothetical protein
MVCFTLQIGIHTNRITYHTCLIIPKQCVMYYRKPFTPDILNHTWYGIHTIWVHVYTQLFVFTPAINLFTLKLDNLYCAVKISHWTWSVLTLTWPHDVASWRRHRTQMTLTPMRKPEGIPIVGEKLFFFLDVSCRLDKHDTCTTSSYTPLILLSHPTGIFCGPRA